MIDELNAYAKGIGASSEVKGWLSTAGKRALERKVATLEELEHILDYLNSSAAPTRLKRMSVVDARRKSKEWTEAQKKRGKNLIDTEDKDLETVHDFLDGTRIVRLKTKSAYQREGFLMSHCVGGYDPSSSDCLIYSYRDKRNLPHATFEVRKNANEIVQIKGKGNGAIHPKYIHPILAFLKTVGMDIRPSDMKNLGYYHIDSAHLEFLKQSDAWEQVAMINGEAYAF